MVSAIEGGTQSVDVLREQLPAHLLRCLPLQASKVSPKDLSRMQIADETDPADKNAIQSFSDVQVGREVREGRLLENHGPDGPIRAHHLRARRRELEPGDGDRKEPREEEFR